MGLTQAQTSYVKAKTVAIENEFNNSMRLLREKARLAPKKGGRGGGSTGVSMARIQQQGRIAALRDARGSLNSIDANIAATEALMLKNANNTLGSDEAMTSYLQGKMDKLNEARDAATKTVNAVAPTVYPPGANVTVVTGGQPPPGTPKPAPQLKFKGAAARDVEEAFKAGMSDKDIIRIGRKTHSGINIGAVLRNVKKAYGR
jgi:hypothetical protein